jgi:hypothetical protein
MTEYIYTEIPSFEFKPTANKSCDSTDVGTTSGGGGESRQGMNAHVFFFFGTLLVLAAEESGSTVYSFFVLTVLF